MKWKKTILERKFRNLFKEAKLSRKADKIWLANHKKGKTYPRILERQRIARV